MGINSYICIGIMADIKEVNNFLWVTTPHGDGQVLFLIDYGPHENLIFVVALEEDGTIKHYNSNNVKLCHNHTFFKIDRNDKK